MRNSRALFAFRLFAYALWLVVLVALNVWCVVTLVRMGDDVAAALAVVLVLLSSVALIATAWRMR